MVQEDVKAEIKRLVAKHHATTVKLSDDMAANPEIAFEEVESSRKMTELLKNAGFQLEYPFAGFDTAFCGALKQGDGPNVAILAEYDALPDIGHACGHNWIGSVSILSALVLAELKDKFKGTLYVIGTPAEEDDGAKIRMSSDGIFDNMDLAILFHPQAGGITQSNMDGLNLRCYIIDFIGVASHSTVAPWEGRNALIAATKFIDLLDARRQSFTLDMRANSIIINGGRSTNVIPEKAAVRIEFRAESMAKIEKMDKMVLNCAKGAALAMDCAVEWRKGLSDFADVVCLKTAQSAMEEILTDLGENVLPVSPATVTTDVGNVSYHCPALQPLFSISDEECTLHSTRFEELTRMGDAYSAMNRAAQAIVRMVLKVFNDENLRREIKKDFNNVLAVKKRGY